MFGNDLRSFALPNGLALDAQDNLYVADANNNRILKFAPVFGVAAEESPESDAEEGETAGEETNVEDEIEEEESAGEPTDTAGDSESDEDSESITPTEESQSEEEDEQPTPTESE
jgi:hypothetical protein